MLYRKVIDRFKKSTQIDEITNPDNQLIRLSGLVGSAVSIVVGTVAEKVGGIHIVVLDNKDDAGYLYNDLTAFWDNKDIFYFPSGYKRSIVYGEPKPAGIVQRNTLLAHLSKARAKSKAKTSNFTIICTYPEALIEKTVTQKEIDSNSIEISVGDTYEIKQIEEMLVRIKFTKTDFVFEPGQYSIRGGIIDIFSYANNQPYRLDLFGDEIDSIRLFDIGTQLSIEKLDKIDILPKFTPAKGTVEQLINFSELLSEYGHTAPTYWVQSGVSFSRSVKTLNAKLSKEESQYKAHISEYKESVSMVSNSKLITIKETFYEVKPEVSIKFNTTAQNHINKNFELLSKFFIKNIDNGYDNFILTQNQNQTERLVNILFSISKRKDTFTNIPVTIHEGFTDKDSKMSLFTDHQLFERHHRYKISSELPKAESLTISQISSLTVGDYVVHIDHGVGKFGGLVKSMEGGKVNETIRLTYKNDDVLLVNVHSLHKISKYRDKDSVVLPKLNKLGNASWQKLKTSTKNKVKDIVNDLVQLYSKRLNITGFAYSSDNYLQNELEASFMYEDTICQQKVTEAIKSDMERPVPMDRLVCGDVGFGKTEIAIRAAFKAVCDSKQVAVLVPTTILALQHYRSFSQRLKEFPVTVESISRSKTTKQTNEVLERLKRGEIDILIGTHKILNSSVVYKDLGLLIVDEEQKFGVTSKEKLRHLRENIDTLTLTATPIPRTLQFSLMGARDLSIISTPPANRQPVTTEVHGFNQELIKEAIDFELSRGGQLYFVHNRVDNISHIASLISELSPTARVAIGHGQMKPGDLEKLITDFIYGEYDVLVATTIIESGIDIPNANTIIINNAQNFGLSDLHQLRGRVGRTNRKAYCYLLVPQSEAISESARRRLRAIEDFSDLGSGFNIAMQDLDIRGAGNLLGGEQSGFISDIGYETYQKILNEAILEFREERGALPSDNSTIVSDNKINYISDCQIDILEDAYIPDDYISNVNEKIGLYSKIDKISGRASRDIMESSLRDRFGKIPQQVLTLLDIVEIRKNAIYMGFEKVIIKNNLLIIHFVYNPKSPYYESDRFDKIKGFIKDSPENFKLKPKIDLLLLSIGNVKGVREAKEIINNMLNAVNS